MTKKSPNQLGPAPEAAAARPDIKSDKTVKHSPTTQTKHARMCQTSYLAFNIIQEITMEAGMAKQSSNITEVIEVYW
eukprot:CAMPEP_0206435776 /NCGR_PEP_ID=MMETSP0324_2-20121206/10087_1 /ASSEMBLY_ACC=CAM_ASM_000836 /TAXON_ID=2866 /ORGANISM="Crypthecodinium cohnii, Strain Seligo" /LENGTH=76 /DNA_ID=CAMNT_0053902811 /DNA_START=569 /DNA_END=799 /DNA_ORIENTATION=+